MDSSSYTDRRWFQFHNTGAPQAVSHPDKITHCALLTMSAHRGKTATAIAFLHPRTLIPTRPEQLRRRQQYYTTVETNTDQKHPSIYLRQGLDELNIPTATSDGIKCTKRPTSSSPSRRGKPVSVSISPSSRHTSPTSKCSPQCQFTLPAGSRFPGLPGCLPGHASPNTLGG